MKHSRRLMRCMMVGALCVAMAMPVLADTKEDVKSQIDTLENQASDLESELSSMKANKTSLESYIAELDTKIKATLSDLNTVSDEIEQTDKGNHCCQEESQESRSRSEKHSMMH